MYDVIKTEKVTQDFSSRNNANSVPKIPQIGVNDDTNKIDIRNTQLPPLNLFSDN